MSHRLWRTGWTILPEQRRSPGEVLSMIKTGAMGSTYSTGWQACHQALLGVTDSKKCHDHPDPSHTDSSCPAWNLKRRPRYPTSERQATNCKSMSGAPDPRNEHFHHSNRRLCSSIENQTTKAFIPQVNTAFASRMLGGGEYDTSIAVPRWCADTTHNVLSSAPSLKAHLHRGEYHVIGRYDQ